MNASNTSLIDLPLFPLQSVLFPGGLLPLQIFEVRYLDMIGKCHKAGTPFGVVCLTQGREVRQRERGAAGGAASTNSTPEVTPASAPEATPAPAALPKPKGEGFANEAFHTVGTLAKITQFERPQPGLMTVRCTGTQRFQIESSQQLPHGLWVAQAHLLPDDPEVTVPEDLAHVRHALQQLMIGIEQQLQGADMPIQQPHLWSDCGWLANRWCELLPLSAEVKQRFMSMDSPLLRLELVSDALDQMGFKLPG